MFLSPTVLKALHSTENIKKIITQKGYLRKIKWLFFLHLPQKIKINKTSLNKSCFYTKASITFKLKRKRRVYLTSYLNIENIGHIFR